MLHAFLEVVVFLFLFCVGVIISLLTGILVFVWTAWWQLRKIESTLPLFKWVTLQEAKAMGLSEFWLKGFLPPMHLRKALDVRPLPNLSPDDLQKTEKLGFMPYTVHLHEFQLTVRITRRKKRKENWFGLKDLLPGWSPQPAGA